MRLKVHYKSRYDKKPLCNITRTCEARYLTSSRHMVTCKSCMVKLERSMSNSRVEDQKKEFDDPYGVMEKFGFDEDGLFNEKPLEHWMGRAKIEAFDHLMVGAARRGTLISYLASRILCDMIADRFSSEMEILNLFDSKLFGGRGSELVESPMSDILNKVKEKR